MPKTTEANATETTWLAQAYAENPDQVFSLDPLDNSILLADPANNSRGFTPEIGDKSLSPMIANMEEYGQTTPGFATLNDTGQAVLYAGFKRLRARQTMAKAQNGNQDLSPILYRIIITPGILSEEEMFERSLSENMFREEMSIMQRVAALVRLTTPAPEGFGKTLTAAAGKMNMGKGYASVMIRFDLLPAITKKGLHSGRISYNAAEKYVALLPTAQQMAKEPEEEVGTLLAAAQTKIAALTEKELAKSGRVTGTAADKETRKTKGADGKAAGGKKQRKPALIISEVDDELAGIKAAKADVPKAELAAAERLEAQLQALKRYVNGGISLKRLVKELNPPK